MSKLNICFYTCVTENYDSLNHFTTSFNSNISLHVITVKNNFSISALKKNKNITLYFIENKFESSLLFNRWYKFYPFEVLSNFDIYVYLDANLILNIENLINFINKSDLHPINLFLHPDKRVLFEEVIYNLSIGKIDKKILTNYFNNIYTSNLSNIKISENCLLIFKNGYINKIQAQEILNKISIYKRDQLILIPLLLKFQIRFIIHDVYLNDFFSKLNHLNTNSLPLILQFFYPIYSLIKYQYFKLKYFYLKKSLFLNLINSILIIRTLL